MPRTYEGVLEELSAPGAPFEISVEEVRGRPMKNFKKREKNIREKIARAVRRGDTTCMIQGDRRISYAEFGGLVWGAAQSLKNDHGFQPGDRLAILAYNSPDWLITLFGAASLGGIGVGLNGWWVENEIEYGLTDSGSRFLVVDERLYPRVEKLIGRIESLEKVFYIGDHAPDGTIPISELLTPSDEIPTELIGEDDPFIILYTSGTTGRPKGCITTHRGTIAQVLGIFFSTVSTSMIDDTPRPGEGSQLSALLTSPLFHVAGIHSNVCVNLTAGAKLVFTEGKFSPEQVMGLIQEEKVSVWSAIPTMLHRVVHHEKVGDYDLSTLRSVSFGGAPTAPETIEKACEVLPIQPTFANAYGLTETHGVATVNAGKTLLGKKTAAGRVIPVLDVRVIGEDGQALPVGELGEITMYGPTITPGYWNKPEATAEAVRDGWLQTGDLGYVDEEGFLFIVDRAKDMILRGGENIYCVEIENCLAEHPEIDEAAVVGVPDEDLGERVKAIIRCVPGADVNIDTVREHVGKHLAAFKVPEFVEFRDEALPRNPAGKLLKNLLRGKGDVSIQVDGAE